MHHATPTSRRPEAARVGPAALLVALLAALLLAAPAAHAQSSADDPTLGLRDHAEARGVRIGTAVDTSVLASDLRYRNIVAGEFSSVTPENVMKWEALEPRRDRLDFTQADRLVAFARRNDQVVHGHTLVWHNQLPAWLTQGSFTNAQLRDLLRQHIRDVVGHFKGRVHAWDVVNEAFNEDGTLRDTIWLRALGPNYIAQAFRWAHRADPAAKLYINDYNVEGINPKSTAMFELVRDLRAEGVPIHGAGMQGHLSLQYGFPGDLAQNLHRFAAIGVETAITEADVRMALPATPELLARQADYYTRMLQACLGERRCVSFTVWGFTDAHSWVPGWFQGEGAATPLDENYQPKPAYTALRDVLRGVSLTPAG